jgi:hypothetical protein
VTRPGEPFDERALPPPTDPWATINRPAATVRLGGADARGGADETVTMPARHPNPDPASTIRAVDQMRFGPGVPQSPPPPTTPGWPATAPRKRRRRLVSMLSSLLTLALLVVVGLYLWQRLRPLEVESATVAVPRPAGNRCDVTVDVVATIHTNGRSGAIRYQWFRTGAAPGAILTEQVGQGQRTASLTLKWTFSGVGSATETATVNIIDPAPLQAGTHVAYRCRRG